MNEVKLIDLGNCVGRLTRYVLKHIGDNKNRITLEIFEPAEEGFAPQYVMISGYEKLVNLRTIISEILEKEDAKPDISK